MILQKRLSYPSIWISILTLAISLICGMLWLPKQYNLNPDTTYVFTGILLWVQYASLFLYIAKQYRTLGSQSFLAVTVSLSVLSWLLQFISLIGTDISIHYMAMPIINIAVYGFILWGAVTKKFLPKIPMVLLVIYIVAELYGYSSIVSSSLELYKTLDAADRAKFFAIMLIDAFNYLRILFYEITILVLLKNIRKPLVS